jgi:hypothetical protein
MSNQEDFMVALERHQKTCAEMEDDWVDRWLIVSQSVKQIYGVL